MAEPSYFVCSKTVDMNMAGVVARPQSKTLAPVEAMPLAVAFKSAGPVTRASRPMPILSSEIFLPHFLESQKAKAWPQDCHVFPLVEI